MAGTQNHECKCVVIIGAGIAGLTAALSLAKFGIHTHIIEKASELSEVGAGIQLSPNANKVLERLGVVDTLKARWVEPSFIELCDTSTLKAVANIPIQQLANQIWRAPYATLRRSDLQNALLNYVQANPHCQLHLDCKIKAINKTQLDQELFQIIGTNPDFIIGADGVHSHIRSIISGNAIKAKFSGRNAWRLSLDAQHRSSLPLSDRRQVTVFMGPSQHIAIYPLDRTGRCNIIYVYHSDSEREDTAHMPLSAKQCHDGLYDMMSKADILGCWPLYEVHCSHWHNGKKLVLIGDAAHAMMPFMAQGAAMAIEDAFCLAHILASKTNNPLMQYQNMRESRIQKVRQRTEFNRFAYHARGPIKFARNVVMGLKSGSNLGRDLDWLYGWTPPDVKI